MMSDQLPIPVAAYIKEELFDPAEHQTWFTVTEIKQEYSTVKIEPTEEEESANYQIRATDPIVPKRGRGRPRKIKVLSDANDFSSIDVEPKKPSRGRGRPRKIKIFHANDISSISTRSRKVHNPDRPSRRPKKAASVKRLLKNRPIDAVRYDTVGHWPANYGDGKGQRCKQCQVRRSTIRCTKCNVHLCLNKFRNCYIKFHTQQPATT